MAMTIFFLLNGLGIVFLLYVLANFWKEGHKPKGNARKYTADYGRRDFAELNALAHPVSRRTQGRLSVIPFQVRERCNDRQAHYEVASGTSDVPVKRISTR
jgi:hypothetical protein